MNVSDMAWPPTLARCSSGGTHPLPRRAATKAARSAVSTQHADATDRLMVSMAYAPCRASGLTSLLGCGDWRRVSCNRQARSCKSLWIGQHKWRNVCKREDALHVELLICVAEHGSKNNERAVYFYVASKLAASV
eukprot:scaffold45140_cov20-Tisochrysis_lutea.AAC.2